MEIHPKAFEIFQSESGHKHRGMVEMLHLRTVQDRILLLINAFSDSRSGIYTFYYVSSYPFNYCCCFLAETWLLATEGPSKYYSILPNLLCPCPQISVILTQVLETFTLWHKNKHTNTELPLPCLKKVITHKCTLSKNPAGCISFFTEDLRINRSLVFMRPAAYNLAIHHLVMF